MYKREFKRFAKKYGKFVEPFAILALIMLFILPVASVLNLSIDFKQNGRVKQEVLGVTSDSKVVLEKVGGIHPIIHNEKLLQSTENLYEYSANINKRPEGSYDKPVMVISNNTIFDQKVTFTLNQGVSSDTLIGLSYNNTNYFLSTPQGETYPHILKLSQGESIRLSILIRNPNNVLFEDSISIGVRTSPDLGL